MKIKNLKKRLQKEVNPAWIWILAITTVIFTFIVYSYLAEPKWLPEPVNNFSKKIVDEFILGEKDTKQALSDLKNNNNSKNNESSQEIDTSNWQTYENKELGFSIKYPEDWKSTKYNDSFIGFAPIDMSEDNLVSVEIKESSTLDKSVSEIIHIIQSNPNREFISKTNIQFNDLDTVEIRSKNKTNNLVAIDYLFEDNSKIYILSGDTGYINAEEIIKTFMLL